MRKTRKEVFYVVVILLLGIFSQEVKAGEANERHYSRAYSVLSANVGNSYPTSIIDPRGRELAVKLQPGPDEERVISGIKDLKAKPDILILIEAYDRDQVLRICDGTGESYFVTDGQYDFVCVKNDIGEVVKHEQMPSGNGNSVGYVDVGLKDEGGRKVRLFYAHFPSPGPKWVLGLEQVLSFGEAEHAAHIAAFEWIKTNIIRAGHGIPYLIAGDLNNDFIRQRDDKRFWSGKYIYEQVTKHNLWIFNPLADRPVIPLPDGRTESDYEATYQILPITIDWVMGKDAVPAFKVPGYRPEVDPVTGTIPTILTSFVTSPPDWWKDTDLGTPSRLTFDHKPLYGKVVFFWEERTQPDTAMKILFVGQKDLDNPFDLFAINPDGSGATRILSGVLSESESLTQITLSPDGKQIATYGGTKGSAFNVTPPVAEIRIMSLDGKAQKTLQLHGLPQGHISPPEYLRWSPDSTKIVFASGNDIYVINIDGTGLTRLTNDGDNYYPNWWPDGQKIIFEKPPPKEGWVLYLINADGNGQVQLANLSSDIATRPEWSQDGRKIAFTGSDGQLLAGEFVGGKVIEAKRLTNKADGWRVLDKRWSKDGSKIAFFDPFKGALVVIDCDGSNLKPILGGAIGLVGWAEIPETD